MVNAQKTSHQKPLLRQNERVVRQTKIQIAETRQRALSRYTAVLNERNKRLGEIGEQLQTTVVAIRAKHELAKHQLNQKAITTEVHVRVSRSLEALEQFLQVLRKSNVTSQRLKDAIEDPAISGSLFDRERRASVSDLLQSVQKQLIQQTEFINIAAHELRTPIMPILANAELLQSGPENESTEEVEIIVRNALRLKHLAENILNVAAIDSASLRLNKEMFDLNLLIRQTVEDKKYNIENKAVRLLFISEADELQIFADKNRLAQVVSNLLDNAIKFTREGEILVTSEKTGGNLLVSVIDGGPGIDLEVFPVLFSKFAGGSQKGTGLGLYICKSIVEAHGGSITARNNDEYGKPGATFAFTLPL